MKQFTYQYPVKQYFGKGCAEDALKKEMSDMGDVVMLAYGGGSLKRTGLYDKIRGWLEDAGKTVVDFGGIMPNPTYAKVQQGAEVVRKDGVDFILAVQQFRQMRYGIFAKIYIYRCLEMEITASVISLIGLVLIKNRSHSTLYIFTHCNYDI